MADILEEDIIQDDRTPEATAAKDVTKILIDQKANRNNYAAVLFVGILSLGILSFVYGILSVIGGLMSNFEYVRIVAISFFSFRGFIFIFLVILPYSIYMFNLNTIRNTKDSLVIESLKSSSRYKESALYHNSSFIYDPRDSRNRRDIGSLLPLIIMTTILSVFFYAEMLHEIDRYHHKKATGDYPILPTDFEIPTDLTLDEASLMVLTKQLGEMLYLPLFLTAAILLLETYIIFTTIHALFRHPLSPPSEILDGEGSDKLDIKEI
jgi:hypothetical protein